MTEPGAMPQSVWQRNWKWLVALGCLGSMIVVAAFVAVLVWVVSVSMRSSDAYKEAVDRAAADCEVRERLGAPLKPGWFVSGSINVKGPSGHADLSIPLHGSARAGTLFVTATKSAGRWHFELLEVEVADQNARISLMDEGRKRCPDARGVE
jgi:hypothetical protein